MQIIDKAISKLKNADYNPRKLSDKQKEDLKKSITEFGEMEPAIINTYLGRENVIISGHQRIKVAKELGKKTWPCIEVSLPIEKEKELNVRMNKNTGEWDWDILSKEFEVEELHDWGFDDISLIEAEKKELLKDDDDVPESPEQPKTKPGDLYILGDHRLLCGDSTNINHVELLIGKDKCDMVFTDPMYNDNVSEFISILELIECDNILLMCTQKQLIDFSLKSEFNFRFDTIFYFKTPSSSMNKKVPYYNHKNVAYFTKNDKTIFHCDNAKGLFSEKGYYPSVIEAKKNTSEVHGLTKPIENIIQLLSGYKANRIIDFYGGSGSTLIACEKTNRECRMMEFDPKYCDVIVKRWEDFTGKKAELQNG